VCGRMHLGGGAGNNDNSCHLLSISSMPGMLLIFMAVLWGRYYSCIIWDFLFLFFWCNWNFRGTSPCLACWLTLGLDTFLSGLALNHDLPHLCLLTSWDYRKVATLPSPFGIF
jgi:hypothetical protein